MKRIGFICVCLIGEIFAATEAYAACRLDDEVDFEDLTWSYCSLNNLSLYGQARKGRDERSDVLGVVADGYVGVYANPRLSAHAKGYFKEVRIYNRETDREESSNSHITEQLYLQLGHPLLDNLNGAVGRLPTPFGLNHEFMRYQLPTRGNVFWDRTVQGLRLSWKIRNDLRLEGGGAWAKREEIASKEAEAFTFRLTEYLDLLSGAKLIASYQNHGKREFGKLGLATVVFFNENTTSLEWVRLADHLGDRTYQQLFRFLHEHQGNDGTSWSLGFEELRKDSYRVYGGSFWDVWEQLKIGTAIQYQRLRTTPKKDNQWWLTFSATYALDFQDEGIAPP